jgi:hypothetical protein
MVEVPQSKSTIVIDLELVYDIWSLLFCCIRSKVPTLTNSDYLKMVNKPVKKVISELIVNPEERDEVQAAFDENFESVKPWIPYF